VNLWGIDAEKGQPILRPLRGDTKMMAEAKSAQEEWRIAKPIVRKDEDNQPYDLTRAFIEEAIFFPFGTHDDLLDAASRIYDMGAVPPVMAESADRLETMQETFVDA